MKTTTTLKAVLMMMMTLCSTFAFAQGNFVIEGSVFIAGTGGQKQAYHPIYIKSINNTAPLSDTTYTDNVGNYRYVIPNGAITGPNLCWEISTHDSCTNIIHRDTVCNMQGSVSVAVVNFEICS